MKVWLDGIVFSIQPHGGISVYFRALLRHLRQLGVDHVLTLEDPTVQPVLPEDVAGSVERRAARTAERYRKARVCQSGSPSVFHSTYYRRPARSTMPTVVTVHDFTYERHARGARRWTHMAQKHAAIRSAQGIICISEATRQDLLQWVGVRPEQEVRVIPNGVAACFQPVPVDPPDSPFVLFVGLRDGYKNFALATQALARLPRHRLLCVGGGALRETELAGLPADVRTRIQHLGIVSDLALNTLYNQATCLLYPSSYEGFGLPVIEAMRTGCPVVSVDCKAVMEVGGHALSVVPGNDPQGLAAAVLALHGGDRAARVTAGLSVAQHYDWQRTHDQTLALYRDVATR